LVSFLDWPSGTDSVFEEDATLCCVHSRVRLDGVAVDRGRGDVYAFDSTLLDLGGDVDLGGEVIPIELLRDAENSIFGDLRSWNSKRSFERSSSWRDAKG
jgi:hypothetical protein